MARLTDDLKNTGINPLDVCWGRYKGTPECPMGTKLTTEQSYEMPEEQ